MPIVVTGIHVVSRKQLYVVSGNLELIILLNSNRDMWYMLALATSCEELSIYLEVRTVLLPCRAL